jgi:hypothetical protein
MHHQDGSGALKGRQGGRRFGGAAWRSTHRAIARRRCRHALGAVFDRALLSAMQRDGLGAPDGLVMVVDLGEFQDHLVILTYERTDGVLGVHVAQDLKVARAGLRVAPSGEYFAEAGANNLSAMNRGAMCLASIACKYAFKRDPTPCPVKALDYTGK